MKTIKEQAQKDEKNEEEIKEKMERNLLSNVKLGQIYNSTVTTFVTSVFSPNGRESILVGLGIKHLDPTKILPTFYLQLNNLKIIFYSYFLSFIFYLLYFIPTKEILRTCLVGKIEKRENKK